jgi:hypothetical protein
MTDLDQTKELMNKIMKKYIDQVRAEPTMYIQNKTPLQRLLNLHPSERKIMMFQDSFAPSYAKTLLSGLEYDFMMLECLVIACMDRANYLPNDIQSGLAFGVLIAYILDYILIWFRSHQGRKNLAMHTLSDERFMID